ncbi:MAG: ATPase, T2SS/T4P/T4SS family [Planctomycetota bacterium]
MSFDAPQDRAPGSADAPRDTPTGAVTDGPVEAPRMRIGDELQRRGLLTDTELQVALTEQRRDHRPLGQILVSLGFVRANEIAQLMSEQMALPLVTADECEPDALLLASLDPDLVRSARAFPIAIEEGCLRVAMVDPSDPRAMEILRQSYPYTFKVEMITEADLELLLRRHAVGGRANEVADLLGGTITAQDDRRVEELAIAVVRDGIRRGATDVHIQPEENLTRVRYRLDGVLQGAESLPREVSDAVVSRLKISARLDIAERRRPQDGRIRMTVDGREVDLRVSVMPNVHGENVVLRVLDRSGGVPPLEDLGVESETAETLAGLAESPHGLFLVTGPTGSGKTTTLYSLLRRVDSIHRNVATIEDPVEYSVPLVRQSQVDSAVGYGFHEGLRALLRQDPDVILVGEIRDEVTADMAIKAAMTGHLVLGTLHTTDALGAIPRLVDLGVPSYLLEDTLLAVMGQRLVRRLCDRCAVPLRREHEEYAATLAWVGPEGASHARAPVGCAACEGAGFTGRTAISELFVPSDATRPFIRSADGGSTVASGPPLGGAASLEEAAYDDGYADLGDAAKLKVTRGFTTLGEVLRVHRPRDFDPAASAGPGVQERAA